VTSPARLAGVAALLAALGCARRAAGPSDTLAAFGAALERGDVAAAYALTSDDFRARTPLAAFKAEVEEGGAATRDAARALRERKPASAPRAQVEVAPGEVLALVEERGAWRVDGHPFEAWGQRTPRAALRTFVRAIEAHRYDVVLRLVPARQRVAVTADALRLYWEGAGSGERLEGLRQLKAALGAPIAESGDEARMPYGDRAEARLVREDGLWKIEDPD
jgi:hypothetical protein